MDIPVEFEITITDENGRDVSETVAEVVRSWPPIRAARAVADCPYAGFVEFGTRPATNPSERDVEDEVFKWAKRKLGADDETARRIARKVHKKIIHHGMLPMPFFRPAIFDTVSDVNSMNGDWLDSGHTLHDIADGIAERARENLTRNDQNYTYELWKSLGTEAESKLPIDPDMPREGDVEEHVWESDELGWDGTRHPPRRWKR